MLKQERLSAIEKIIRSEPVSSQEELLMKLEDFGISCTQATLSRNLRQLRVSRVPYQNGKIKYELPAEEEIHYPRPEISDFKKAITERIWTREMMLIKTYPGYAAAIASAIDRSGKPEIAGTIAGDDTVLVIPHDKCTRETIENVISQIFS
ncbi:MAG: ArgR family transcriptional regulator [Bacteroidales bacterium]|nr:ArgR family transcriptional regulator [Bacteroidales bacterium]